MYNKSAIYKFKELNPDKYKEMTLKATQKWKEKNPEKNKEYDRKRKSKFMTEWRTLRNIDLF
jgi:hypothetical protein